MEHVGSGQGLRSGGGVEYVIHDDEVDFNGSEDDGDGGAGSESSSCAPPVQPQSNVTGLFFLRFTIFFPNVLLLFLSFDYVKTADFGYEKAK